MRQFRNFLVTVIGLAFMILPVLLAEGAAPGPKVSADKNKHNLSSGTVTGYAPTFPYNTTWTPGRDNSIIYKAADKPDTEYSPGRQVCIFCHTPHSGNVSEGAPLWNRKFSTQTFSRYSSQTLQIRVNPSISASASYGTGWVPDGSTKLCLSCHDGVSLLGATSGADAGLLRGGAITMDSSKDYTAAAGQYIGTRASFKPSTNKMKTGHHPVSFKYSDGIATDIRNTNQGLFTNTYQAPTRTKLKSGKMQCTTCHDAHQNQSDDDACFDNLERSVGTCSTFGNMTSRKVAPFWAYRDTSYNGPDKALHDRQAVCNDCHTVTLNDNLPVWDPRPDP